MISGVSSAAAARRAGKRKLKKSLLGGRGGGGGKTGTAMETNGRRGTADNGFIMISGRQHYSQLYTLHDFCVYICNRILVFVEEILLQVSDFHAINCCINPQLPHRIIDKHFWLR